MLRNGKLFLQFANRMTESLGEHIYVNSISKSKYKNDNNKDHQS